MIEYNVAMGTELRKILRDWGLNLNHEQSNSTRPVCKQ